MTFPKFLQISFFVSWRQAYAKQTSNILFVRKTWVTYTTNPKPCTTVDGWNLLLTSWGYGSGNLIVYRVSAPSKRWLALRFQPSTTYYSQGKSLQLHQGWFPPKCEKLTAGSSENYTPLKPKKNKEKQQTSRILRQNGLITPRFLIGSSTTIPQMRWSLRQGSFPGSCPSLPQIWFNSPGSPPSAKLGWTF